MQEPEDYNYTALGQNRTAPGRRDMGEDSRQLAPMESIRMLLRVSSAKKGNWRLGSES